MKRITNKNIEAVLEDVNRLLGKPQSMFQQAVGTRMSPGHIYADKNAQGWQIEQIISEGGSVRALSTRGTAREAFTFACGMRDAAKIVLGME